MKYFKLFEEFSKSINEGAISIYAPKGIEIPSANKIPKNEEKAKNAKIYGKGRWKPTFTMTWTGVKNWLVKWIDSGLSVTVIPDIDDYDQANGDPAYQSVALGTWGDDSLPLFSSKNPKYNQVEFDVIDFMENKENPREPWIQISDKDGKDFYIPPFKIVDIQLGDSIAENVYFGFRYSVDGKIAYIADFRNRKVTVKFIEDGTEKTFPVGEWKRRNFRRIDESNTEEFEDSVND